jgi:endoglycosylceramidase
MQPISHVGPWLVDATGRVVQLHGLTLYQKKPPFIDRISDTDLDYVTSQGFNSFRINWIWQAVEPQPNQYDDAYLDQVVGLNEQMAKHGIRTLFGPAQNSMSAKFGGFGVPIWAVLNRKFCTAPGEDLLCGVREQYRGSDGEFEAWDNFYDNAPGPDGLGILTHFNRTWQRLAKRLKGKNNVYALDLFHEPPPSGRYVEKGERRFLTEPVTFERDALPRLYQSIGNAVRQVNDGPMRFFQVSDYFTLEATAASGIHVPPKLLTDPQMGLSFHFGPIDVATISNEIFVEKTGQALTTASTFARNAQVALMLTGYRLSTREDQYAVFTDLLGSRFIPWNYYTFKGMSDTGAQSSGMFLDPSQPASESNMKSERIDSMVVPYPQLTAGTPTQWSFDRRTRVMQFAYSTQPVGPRTPCNSAATEIFIPARHYPDGYTATVTGAKIISSPTSAWLVLQRSGKAGQVSVVVSPRIGSHTEQPATALGPTANARCP